MEAMILAAGFATRLRPLSYTRPKVLLPICNRPLLEIIVEYLSRCGFKRVTLNAHHLANKLRSHINHMKHPLEISISYEHEILGTGGGICKMARGARSDLLVIINGDIITNVDLQGVLRDHGETGAPVSMVLADIPGHKNVAVAKDNRVVGFGEETNDARRNSDALKSLAFTGIHVAEREFLLKYALPEKFFSILDVYRMAIKKGERIHAISRSDISWHEVGSIGGYWEVHRRIRSNPREFLPWFRAPQFPVVHRTASVNPRSRLSGIICVGRESTLEQNTVLKNVIIWSNARVKEGSQLQNVILGDECTVKGLHQNRIICHESK